MQNRPLFITQFLVLLAVAAVHLSALTWSLYWRYPWFDTVSHFLGALWIALALEILFTYSYRYVSRSDMLIFAITLCVGMAWEVWEVKVGISGGPTWFLDTTSDMLMNTLGGVSGIYLTRTLR